MSKARVDELLLAMDRAFDGGPHSLLANLATVRAESWCALPQGGERSIQEIVAHVGRFKFIYANHGFRGADLDYDDHPATPAHGQLESISGAVVWLREAHSYLVDCLNELESDDELEVGRRVHWGDIVPTRRIIVTMLEHDLYHAGEINRTRALLQGDDGWQ